MTYKRRNIRDAAGAARAHLTLPADLADLLDLWDSLERQAAEHGRATPRPVMGRDPAGHSAAVAAWTQAEATRRDLTRTIGFTRQSVRIQVNAYATERGDELITEVIAPGVAELARQARPLTATLAEYAPDYDAGAILATGSKAAIEAWRKSRTLDQAYQAARDLYLTLVDYSPTTAGRTPAAAGRTPADILHVATTDADPVPPLGELAAELAAAASWPRRGRL